MGLNSRIDDWRYGLPWLIGVVAWSGSWLGLSLLLCVFLFGGFQSQFLTPLLLIGVVAVVVDSIKRADHRRRRAGGFKS